MAGTIRLLGGREVIGEGFDSHKTIAIAWLQYGPAMFNHAGHLS